MKILDIAFKDLTRSFRSALLNGRGAALDHHPVFGKPQAYRTESGKAATLMKITVTVFGEAPLMRLSWRCVL